MCWIVDLSLIHAQESEHKGFMDKLYAIQEVFISVQSALDEVASYGERIKKWVKVKNLMLATVAGMFLKENGGIESDRKTVGIIQSHPSLFLFWETTFPLCGGGMTPLRLLMFNQLHLFRPTAGLQARFIPFLQCVCFFSLSAALLTGQCLF